MDDNDSPAVRPGERTARVHLDVRVTEDASGAVRVELDGELDLTTAPSLRSALATAMTSAARIDVDLSGLRFMGAAGVSVLVEAHSAGVLLSCAVRIVRPSSTVRRVLAVTAIDHLLAVDDR